MHSNQVNQGLESQAPKNKTSPAGKAYLSGLRLLELKKPKAARKAFHRALKLGLDDDPLVYCRLGLAHLLGGQDDWARVYLDHALRLDDKLFLALFTLANLEMKKGRWSEAERFLTRALKQQPGDLDCYHWRAVTRICQGKLSQAAADLEYMLSRESDRVDALLLLSDVQRDLGNFAAAAKSLDLAIRKNPDEAAGHVKKARLRLTLWAETASFSVAFTEEAKEILTNAEEAIFAAQLYAKVKQLEIAKRGFESYIDPLQTQAEQRLNAAIEIQMREMRQRASTEPAAASLPEQQQDLWRGEGARLERLELLRSCMEGVGHELDFWESVGEAEYWCHLYEFRGLLKKIVSSYTGINRRWQIGSVLLAIVGVALSCLGALISLDALLSAFDWGFVDLLVSWVPQLAVLTLRGWPILKILVGLAWFGFGWWVGTKPRQHFEARTLAKLRSLFDQLVRMRAFLTVHLMCTGLWHEESHPLPNRGMPLADLISIMKNPAKPLSIRERAGLTARLHRSIPNSEETQQLESLLTDATLSKHLRQSIALMLARKGQDTAVPILREMLAFAESLRDGDALNAMRQIGAGNMTEIWYQSLSTEMEHDAVEEKARYFAEHFLMLAIWALGQIKARSSTEALLDFLRAWPEGEERVRFVVEALVMQATDESVDTLGQLAEEAFNQKSNAELYLEGLAKIGNASAVARLLAFQTSLEPQHAGWGSVMRAIARCDHPDARVQLGRQLRLLDDDSVTALLRDLRWAESRTASLVLRDLARDENVDWGRRWKAVETLAQSGDREAESLGLELWCHGQDAQVLWDGFSSKPHEVLAEIGSERTLGVLKELLASDQGNAESAMRAAIGLAAAGRKGWEVLAGVVADEHVGLTGRALSSAALAARGRPEADLELMLTYLTDDSFSEHERKQVILVLLFLASYNLSAVRTVCEMIIDNNSIPRLIRHKARLALPPS